MRTYLIGMTPLQKILLAVGANCVSSALLISVLVPPAKGFELSIVDMYPISFWVLAPAGTACGISILVLEAFSSSESRGWTSGLVLVIASNLVLLTLPLLHGYASYPKGDAQSHLGFIKDILTTGHFGASNFYPIVHIAGTVSIEVGSISPLILPIVLYTSWSVLFYLSMYLLAKSISSSRRQFLLIMAFASPLIFSDLQTVIHPSMLALFLMPMLLFAHHRRLQQRSGRVESTVIMLLLALAITFTHPITAIFAILVLVSLTAADKAFRKKSPNTLASPVLGSSGWAGYRVPLIMSVTFLIWYTSYVGITRDAIAVLQWLVSPQANSVFAQQTSVLGLAGLTASQTIELFTFRYGAVAIYLALSTVAAVWLLRTWFTSESRDNSIALGYATALVLALGMSAYSFLGFTGETDPIRVSRFYLLLAPVVCGLSLGRTGKEPVRAPHRRPRVEARRQVFIVGVILVATALYTVGLYSSALTVEGNWQISAMELRGSQWFFEHQDRNLITHVLTGDYYLRRFQDMICGMDTCPASELVRFSPLWVPSHFGYPNNDTIAETLGPNAGYLITYKQALIAPLLFPTNVRPTVHQYNDTDFIWLSNDPTTSEIYANGQFDVWITPGP